MQETTTTETTIDAELDAELDGIVPELKQVLRDALVAADGVRSRAFDSDIAAAHQVKAGVDGSVLIDLALPIVSGGQDIHRIRLRTLVARDYFQQRTGDDADDQTLIGSVRFATNLVEPKGAIDALRCSSDMKAVFFGVLVLRAKFSSRPT